MEDLPANNSGLPISIPKAVLTENGSTIRNAVIRLEELELVCLSKIISLRNSENSTPRKNGKMRERYDLASESRLHHYTTKLRRSMNS
jgi:hypothetical protein